MTVIFYYADGSKRILKPQIPTAKGISSRLIVQQLCHDFGASSFKIKT